MPASGSHAIARLDVGVGGSAAAHDLAVSKGAATKRGVAAVETAAAILSVLNGTNFPIPLNVLSKKVGLPPAQTYHYLVSLIKTGMVLKEEGPPRYSLGPFAVRMGLSAVDRLELQHLSATFLRDASLRTGEATHFSIWSPDGPVVVRWEQGMRPLTVFARLGTVMPLLRSATGQVFATWGPPKLIEVALERALRELPPGERLAELAAVSRWQETALQTGLGVTAGAMLPEISAVSSPVYDSKGGLAGAITVLGLARGFDISAEGSTAGHLREVAQKFSVALGYDGMFFTMRKLS